MRFVLAAVIAAFSAELQAGLSWAEVDRVRIFKASELTTQVPLFISDVLDAAAREEQGAMCFSFYSDPYSYRKDDTHPDAGFPAEVIVRWFPTMSYRRAVDMNEGVDPGVLLGKYCTI